MYKLAGALFLASIAIAGCGSHTVIKRVVVTATPLPTAAPVATSPPPVATPTPDANTVAWVASTVKASQQVRGGLLQVQGAVAAVQQNDATTAETDLKNAETTFVSAQYTLDNGPFPPPAYKTADLDFKISINDYETGTNMLLAGLQQNNNQQVKGGMHLVEAGNAAIHQAYLAEKNA